MDVMKPPERSRISLVHHDGYPQRFEDEAMDALDAEESIYFAFLRENDSLPGERAKQLAADFIQDGRNLHVVAITNTRQRHYFGHDPFAGWRYIGCC